MMRETTISGSHLLASRYHSYGCCMARGYHASQPHTIARVQYFPRRTDAGYELGRECASYRIHQAARGMVPGQFFGNMPQSIK